MTLHVISVAYERPIAMRILIDCFLVQTNPNWDLLMVHDGEASDAVKKTISLYNDPRIRIIETETRTQQYGHINRQRFLREFKCAPSDYILLTNDDNYYCPVFVDKVLKQCNSITGIVYFDAVHSHFDYDVLKSIIKVDRIDVGSFIVRSDIAKMVGFNHFQFNGDGIYAEECLGKCQQGGLLVSYLPKPLFVHN